MTLRLFKAQSMLSSPTKKVVDIKYQSMTLVLRFTNGVPSESIIVDRALIIYEE
nr:MAG TPA: Sporulation protein Cse60 [Caudoviricetes sp.]